MNASMGFAYRKKSLSDCCFKSICSALLAAVLHIASALATPSPEFNVGPREVVATKAQRDALGLKWFMDGTLGAMKSGDEVQLYGANGSKPVRVTGTPQNPLHKVDRVMISTSNRDFRYLSGGPIFVDPQSKRIFLFYHAEIHRGTEKNFYSVLGLSVQTDEKGLEFTDLGPIFMANVSNEKALGAVEECGAPYIIKEGYFYVYARDKMSDGNLRVSNLSVARAKVADVVQAGLKGRNVEWRKYCNQTFSEPATGGKSTPLEKGNPGTRWMDMSYNTVLKKYIMVVAANTWPAKVELFMTCSDDGIVWSERKKLASENGESFYPSILGFRKDSRQTGAEFYIYYTYSRKGGWGRWEDAVIARRRISIADDRCKMGLH